MQSLAETERIERDTNLTIVEFAEHRTIAFFGIFGVQNLGNECTLQAILSNAAEQVPDAKLVGVSYDPEDTCQRHKITCIPVEATPRVRSIGTNNKGHVRRLLRLIFRRGPSEIMDLRRAARALRGTQLVLMTGTGMLTDYSTSAMGYPYHVFKWTLGARLAGCKVRFVGVGVGPIYSPLSRWFIKSALWLADYRSYRDHFSKERIRKYGFKSDIDPVFPDLAFSLPPQIFPKRAARIREKPVVGIGIMQHADVHIGTPQEQRAAQCSYFDKMCEFISWLLQNQYEIRILQGDSRWDPDARKELRTRLEQRGIHYEKAPITDEGCNSVDQLLRQLAECDFIVSPRFHNLVLGLMLGIPVISISYDPKNDCLLEQFGLSNYRQTMDKLDVQKLTEQFADLVAHSSEVKPTFRSVAEENRELLAEQYKLLFEERRT